MTQSTAPEGVRLTPLRAAFQRGDIDRSALRRAFSGASNQCVQIAEALVGSGVAGVDVRPDGVTLNLASGVRLRLHEGDEGSAAAIAFCQGDFEAEETKILTALCEGRDVFVDVGANIGWFSLHIGRVLRQHAGHVYAIEPVPQSRDELVAHVSLNGLADVISVWSCALGAAPGEMELIVPTAFPSAASARPLHPDLPSDVVRCPVTTLDLVAAQHGVAKVDVIKCDVEGAELMVLDGAMGVITRDRPVMMFELLRKWSQRFGYHPNIVIDRLTSLGYRCFAIGKGDVREIGEIDDATVETNFLFVHGDGVAEFARLEVLRAEIVRRRNA